MIGETPVNKILILVANPKGMSQLRLNEELRDIGESLQRARNREQFEFKLELAVRTRDIRRHIMDFEPQIVHFCGHGEGENGLVFEDVTGKAKLVNAEALAALFEYFADHVKCVLLNACFSEVQAKGIVQHIDYVIGMSQAIGDRAAIEFAVGFYDALGAGKTFENAYKSACVAIQMESISERLTPQLLRKPVHLSSEKGVDYTQLQDLLEAKKWIEADKETLTVMLKATGREEEGKLDYKSIKNLPCKDLRTIDQLWLKYSNGRFGFSVQKSIWKDVGGKSNPDFESFERFYERVGWLTYKFEVKKTKNMWFGFKPKETSIKHWILVDYFDLTFSATAPEGHLPRNGFLWMEFMDSYSTLLSMNIEFMDSYDTLLSMDMEFIDSDGTLLLMNDDIKKRIKKRKIYSLASRLIECDI